METETEEPASPGILESLRAFGDGVLASLYDRIELFSVELQEEKIRLIQLIVWIGAAVFSAMLAIVFISLAVVYYFGESARLAVLGGFAFGYTALFLGLVISFRRYLARQPRPFSATLQEIKEDRACLHPKN